jgi:hypothetical protein
MTTKTMIEWIGIALLCCVLLGAVVSVLLGISYWLVEAYSPD